MTRFWITLEQAVDFVIDCAASFEGGEVFVPKIPSMRVTDLAEAIAPGCEQRVIGIRPGEKLHEILVTSDESRHCYEQEGRYVIVPEYASWGEIEEPGTRPPDGFYYSSDNNDRWLDVEGIREMAAPVAAAAF